MGQGAGVENAAECRPTCYLQNVVGEEGSWIYKKDEARPAPPPRLEDYAHESGYQAEEYEAPRSDERADDQAREAASAAATVKVAKMASATASSSAATATASVNKRIVKTRTLTRRVGDREPPRLRTQESRPGA